MKDFSIILGFLSVEILPFLAVEVKITSWLLLFLNFYLVTIGIIILLFITVLYFFQVCQLIYFIIAPCADILTLLKGHEDNWLVRLRDTLFCALAFPLGVVRIDQM